MHTFADLKENLDFFVPKWQLALLVAISGPKKSSNSSGNGLARIKKSLRLAPYKQQEH
jgi:hypothetical protein